MLEIAEIYVIIQSVRADPFPPAASNMSPPAAFASSGDPDRDKKIRNLRKVSQKLTKTVIFFTNARHLTKLQSPSYVVQSH
jgi:hypothetical protein